LLKFNFFQQTKGILSTLNRRELKAS